MPLKRYGVLTGKALDARRETEEQSPHYQVHIAADTIDYRIAVNVKSKLAPSELLFLVADNFHHPLLPRLLELDHGFTPLERKPGSLALDFIRGNLFDRLEMRPLPANLPGPQNDLSDQVEHFVNRAMGDPDAVVYAFGERWGPESDQRDKIFSFEPGNGIHDIHMNQGNAPAFKQDDGVWQDGALIIHLPSTQQWVAIFLAFQSQAWHTDDTTGHALEDVKADQVVRIAGALVNAIGPAPEHETVTLINASPVEIDLGGWRIADKGKHTQALSGTITAGGTRVIALSAPVQLGNKGGVITLLNEEGVKVDGVAYTAEQAKREGWTIVF